MKPLNSKHNNNQSHKLTNIHTINSPKNEIPHSEFYKLVTNNESTAFMTNLMKSNCGKSICSKFNSLNLIENIIVPTYERISKSKDDIEDNEYSEDVINEVAEERRDYINKYSLKKQVLIKEKIEKPKHSNLMLSNFGKSILSKINNKDYFPSPIKEKLYIPSSTEHKSNLNLKSNITQNKK